MNATMVDWKCSEIGPSHDPQPGQRQLQPQVAGHTSIQVAEKHITDDDE